MGSRCTCHYVADQLQYYLAMFLWGVKAGEAVSCKGESVSVDHSGRDAAREGDSEMLQQGNWEAFDRR